MSPLVKKIIPLMLGAEGVDRGSNPQTVTTKFLKAENCRYTQNGKISKRLGYGNIAGTYNQRNATSYNDRATLIDRELYVHEGTDWAGGSMRSIGNIAVWDVVPKNKQQTQSTKALQPNFAKFINGTMIEVVNESDAIGASTISFIRTYSQSGHLIQEGSVSTPGSFHSRVIVDAGEPERAYVFYCHSGTLRYVAVSSAGVIGAEQDTGLSATVNQPMDMCQIDTSGIWMGLVENSTNNGVTLCHLDIANTTYNSVNVPSTACQGVGCWQQKNDLWVGVWFDSPNISHVGYNPESFTETFAPAFAGAALGAGLFARNFTGIAENENDAVIFYSEQDTGTPAKPQIRKFTGDYTTSISPTTTSQSTIFGKSTIVNDCFIDNGRAFLGVLQNDYNMWYLIDEDGLMCAKSLVESAAPNESTNDYFISNTSLVDNAYIMSCGQLLDADGTTIASTYLNVTNPTHVRSVDTENLLLIGGSLPQIFDGENIVEQGYAIGQMDAPTCSAVAAPPGNVDAGAHDWVYTYQWYDANGQLHESFPSKAQTFTATATKNVNVLCECLHNTNKDDVIIVVYRTQVVSAADTTLYRVGSVANNSGLDTVTFNDTIADSTIKNNAPIYTTGGVYEAAQPPSGKAHCIHQNRHFIVNAERPTTEIRYSKPIEKGIAPEHNGAFVVNVSPDGGDIIAIRSFSDKLIIFKENSIYALSGSGLTKTGTGVGFKDPYILSEAIGCTSEKSVVRMPGSLAFNSNLGIHMIGKTGAEAIGNDVRWYTENYDYNAGQLLPEQHCIVWVSSNGPAIVFDFLYSTWVTWLNSNALDVTVQGEQLVMTGAGAGNETLQAQVDGIYTDNGVAFQTKFETGWISLAGLAGFKRIYKVLVTGYNLASHSLTMKFQYNLAPYWEGDIALNTSTISKFDSDDYYGAGLTSAVQDDALIMEGHPNREKVTSIRIQLADTDQTNVSFDLTGLSLVAGLKTGAGPEIGNDRTGS